jgi:hypothetical protein
MKLMMNFGARAKNALADTLKKAKSDDADSNTPTPTYVKDAVIFKLADEKVKSSLGREYEVPDAVWQLLQRKVHIQLNTLTSANIKLMLENPGSIKTKKGIDTISSKLHLLDQSQFGREEDISQAQWHEAWYPMAEIYKTVAEGDIKDYFLDHHKFCASQEDFADIFPAIQMFDIKFRRSYMLTQTRMSRADYISTFQDCKVQAMHDKLLASTRPQFPSSGKASSSSLSSNNRFEPYPGSSSRAEKPFQKGTSSTATISLCLICGRSGHLGSSCTNGTTEKGRKVVSGWINGKLILLANKTELCLSWNLSSNTCRSTHNSSFHHCSICGAKSHHASSRQCL